MNMIKNPVNIGVQVPPQTPLVNPQKYIKQCLCGLVAKKREIEKTTSNAKFAMLLRIPRPGENSAEIRNS
jgi:hypothetical protein